MKKNIAVYSSITKSLFPKQYFVNEKMLGTIEVDVKNIPALFDSECDILSKNGTEFTKLDKTNYDKVEERKPLSGTFKINDNLKCY